MSRLLPEEMPLQRAARLVSLGYEIKKRELALPSVRRLGFQQLLVFHNSTDPEEFFSFYI